MNISFRNFFSLFVFICFVACKNSTQEINDFLADKNLPVGVAENMHHVYKKSGIITSKLSADIFWDFSNRKEHPYSEFPQGIHLVSINSKTRDSITILGDYAISYSKTKFSIIEKNVKIINHKENSILETSKMYSDEKLKYFFTDKPFVLYTETDTIHGVGFESDSKLHNWILSNTYGIIDIKNQEE